MYEDLSKEIDILVTQIRSRNLLRGLIFADGKQNWIHVCHEPVQSELNTAPTTTWLRFSTEHVSPSVKGQEQYGARPVTQQQASS